VRLAISAGRRSNVSFRNATQISRRRYVSLPTNSLRHTYRLPPHDGQRGGSGPQCRVEPVPRSSRSTASQPECRNGRIALEVAPQNRRSNPNQSRAVISNGTLAVTGGLDWSPTYLRQWSYLGCQGRYANPFAGTNSRDLASSDWSLSTGPKPRRRPQLHKFCSRTILEEQEEAMKYRARKRRKWLLAFQVSIAVYKSCQIHRNPVIDFRPIT